MSPCTKNSCQSIQQLSGNFALNHKYGGKIKKIHCVGTMNVGKKSCEPLPSVAVSKFHQINQNLNLLMVLHI